MGADSSGRIEQTAAVWLAHREAGDWSEADAGRLDAWLTASTSHRVAFLRLEATWIESGRLKAFAAGLIAPGPPPRMTWTPRATTGRSPDEKNQAAHPDLTFAPRRPAPPPRWALRAGLAATILLCGALVAWGLRDHTRVDSASYASEVGSLRDVRLIDGSQATLSSGSRIEVAMSRHQRRIELRSGEAFFDAAKDSARPFVVAAEARRVVAVGTRFSVRRDGADLRVVVAEGLVRLESDPVPGQPPTPVTLLPAGSTALATRSGVLVRTGTVAEAERALDWRSGFLHFEDTPLSEAAAEFNRYGGRMLVMGDADVAALRIGGNLRWSNVDGFVHVIEQGFGVRAERRGDLIVLHSR